MHTTEQAKRLWCPMVRSGAGSDPALNAIQGADRTGFDFNCIADKCAMWRWKAGLVRSRNDRESRMVLKPSTTHGYCGLAGSPAA